MSTPRAYPAAIAIGAFGGLAAGLLGVGGGIVMVPGLVIVLHVAQRRAHATSLAAIIPIGVVSAALYIHRGDVDYAIALFLGAGSVVGAPLGVRALARASERVLRALFVLVALISAVRLLIGSTSGGAAAVHHLRAPDALIAVGVGLFAGAFAGLLGVGGGIVMVPAMTILLEQTQHVAQGTSLLVIIATAITATVANTRRGLLDRERATALGAGGALGAIAGAVLAGHLGDITLKRVFGIFLIAVALRLLLMRPSDEQAA